MTSFEQAAASTRLTALVRRATRSTNKMLAGSRIKVIGESTQALTKMLVQFGAIVSDAPLDFLFIVGDPHEAFTGQSDLNTRLWRPARDLPTIIVTEDDTASFVARLTRETDAQPVPNQQRSELIELENPAGERLAVTVAPHGQADAEKRIAWALRGMPTTRALLEEHRGSIAGKRLTVSLLLEPKTAALVAGLHNSGADVTVFAPESETDPTVARALHDLGVRVCAPKAGIQDAASTAEYPDEVRARESLDTGPQFLIDDGAHLIRLAHTQYRKALTTLRAAAEETTSGVRPLIEMDAEDELKIPVIAVNNARTKTLFDNRVGTGESCLMAIAEETELMGKNCVIFGYGPVGQGCARAAAAFGSRVSVIERDSVAALQALTDGWDIGSLESADLVISATGVWQTITEEHLNTVPDGTVLAVAGGIDGEIADIRRKNVTVLADGAGVNYTAGEGNPLEVMDLSFATQVAALADLIHTPDRTAGVYQLSVETEEEIARTALAARGVEIPENPRETRPGGAAQHWTTHRFRLD